MIPDPNQPRKYFGADKMAQLKNSIKTHGIISPISVQKEGDKYIIVDGERRFRAAKELGLKEIPFMILTAKDPVARAIEQFHLQEQHEAWSPTEKAQVLMDLAETLKKPLQEVSAMLGINERTGNTYISFSRISDKDRFIEKQIPIVHAEMIQSLKRNVKDTKEKYLEENFTLTDERKLERIVVDMIKDSEIINKKDYAKLKSIFRAQPKLIDKFMNDPNRSISDMYVKSKAQGTQLLKNMVQSASYAGSYSVAYLKNPEAKMTVDEVTALKTSIKHLKAVVSFVGDDTED